MRFPLLILALMIGSTSRVQPCQLSAISSKTANESARRVDVVMQRALARCQSEEDGVVKISWRSPTDADFEEIESLGQSAIPPLAKYLEFEHKDGFSQLLAVKFLKAIGGPLTKAPLERALAKDQWEVTRAQALDALYLVSVSDAMPHLRAAVHDSSALVRQRAIDLLKMSSQQK